jgi:DNA helicase-2/ATP-dependent DNA helicase PcrA
VACAQPIPAVGYRERPLDSVIVPTAMEFDRLDATQRAAAISAERFQLVLAGPGAGKTTTLTARFVHLVRKGIDRKRILALTFTKKAADEMKARIARALALAGTTDLSVATFHGFAFRHLRRNPQIAGLPLGFKLWDTAQQRQVFNSRQMWWNEETDILEIIAGAKERLLDPASFAAEIDKHDEMLVSAVEFFKVYERARKTAGAIDFADMVPLVFHAMDNNAGYCKAITGAYDHLLVDEFQDVNPGQVELIDRFVNAGVHLWAVGDDDQTLYAFRAADARYTLEFAKKYRGAQVHVLTRNYRSAGRIVDAAKRLIANNGARLHKDYQPCTNEAGEIVIRGYGTPEVEARQIARGVAKLLKQLPSQQIAVLYRTGSVGLALQPAFKELGIPYEVRGGGDVWQGVAARLLVGSLYYLRDGESIDAMSRMGSSRRADIIRHKLDLASANTKPSFAASCRLVRDTVLTAVPGRASDRDRAEWRSIVEAIAAVALSCASLEELEQRIAEQSAVLREPPENAVVLSTIHSAKGLEWEAVLMVGMEDGVLPHFNNDDTEEERRVAYVGITRAKRILGLTYSNVRYGQQAHPSPFLRQLAGRSQSVCAWTGPGMEGSDERLPIMSDRERRRITNGAAIVEASSADRPRPLSKTDKVGPARHGRSWNTEEDELLRTMFLRGEPVAAMAWAHQRKKGAIRSRLVKLGLVVPESGTAHRD